MNHRTPRPLALGLALAALAACGLSSVAASTWSTVTPIEQPLAFNHAVHIEEEEMECLDCHAGAAEERWAGLPDIRECYDCHQEDQGDNAEEEDKVRQYAKRKQQIPFLQVNRNLGHVYFSHRMHVTVAEMECDSCHPGVAEMERPHAVPTSDLLSMRACMDCHAEEGATLECIACHQ